MDYERYVKKRVKPIFDKALQEMPKNHMMVGWVGFNNYDIKRFCFFQPHNLKHFFDYNKAFFKPFDPTPKRLGVVTPELINYGKEYLFTDFMGCNIRVKKTQIEIKNNINFKKWYDIKISREEHLRIHVDKVHESITVLNKFISVYGGSSSFKLLNIYSEDKFSNESFVDSIALKSRWHNEVSKKVYEEQTVEMPPAFAANYLTNQAALMEDFDIIKWCAANIHCVDHVFKLDRVIRTMSFDNRMFVSNFLFEKLGGARV